MSTPKARKLAAPRKCENCDNVFSPRADYIKRGTGKYCSEKCGGEAKQIITATLEEIIRLYTVEDMTMKEIQTATGMNRRSIQRRLEKSGVAIRTPNRRPAKKRGNVMAPGHPNARPSGSIIKYRITATEKYGRPMFDNEVVHHLDGDPTNDNSDNLVIVTRSYHSKLHQQLQKIACELYKRGDIIFNAEKQEYALVVPG